MDEFKAQDLANTAWAFATADHSDSQLFAWLARAAERRMGEFNAQTIVNTAWASATADHSDALMLEALARVAEQRIGEFNAQSIANTAWASATADHSDALLFAGDFNAQGLAHLHQRMLWHRELKLGPSRPSALCESCLVTFSCRSQFSIMDSE